MSTVRVPLSNSPKLVGAVSSRGTRTYVFLVLQQIPLQAYLLPLRYIPSHQEDRYKVCCIQVDPVEISSDYEKRGVRDWDYSRLPTELASQLLYAGLFDGCVNTHIHTSLALIKYQSWRFHGFGILA